MRRITVALVAVSVLTAAAGGAAYASIPDAGGVIHACYTGSGTRIVDNPKCKSGEKALAWNIKGNQGNQGPAGPAGAGAGPQMRAGHCALVLNPLAPATDYTLTCTYTHPFPDKCAYPEVSVTGAYLGDYMSEDGPVWYPGKDFTWWVYGQEGADDSCNANVTSVHIGIHTLHAVPAGGDQATLGFTYIATVPQ